MNLGSGDSNFRTHEWVEILSLKRDGFDISLYQAQYKGGAFIAPRRVIKSGGYQIIFGKGRALIRERRLFE